MQKAYLDGIGSQYDDFTFFNLPYVGSYPSRYGKIWLYSHQSSFKTKSGRRVKGRNVGFCNLSGLKHFSRYLSLKRSLIRWCIENKDQKKILLIYAVTTPFLKACCEIKGKFNDVKIVQIVPDLPEFMVEDNGGFKDRLRKLNRNILNKLYDDVDGYILLSKHMAERLSSESKPSIVIEGIYSGEIKPKNDKSQNTKNIFYGGTLAGRYGIMNLVDAFMQVQDADARLQICGDGDSRERVIEAAKEDSRIQYLGQLERHEVLEYQRKAFLLVNPRNSEGEFTKYSFPSKTMEYLASGTPSLIYRLPGIPDEYYDHCFSINNPSVAALASKISEILNLQAEKLQEISTNAQSFIAKNKMPESQCKKVIEFIKSL